MLLVPNAQDVPKLLHPPRVAILASGSGSNFESIAQHVRDGALNITLDCVVCNNPGAGVLTRSRSFDVPSRLINHRDYASREAFDEAIIDFLKPRGVQWLVMAGWMRLVTPTLINAFEGRVLNIHPSLLPSFKGLHAVEQALNSGVKIAGCTVHFVVPEMDAGPIVGQAAVPVLPDDTSKTLQTRIQSQEHALYPRAIAEAMANHTPN